MELLPKKIEYAHLENTSGDMRMPSDLQLIYMYMVPRNSIPIVKYKHYQISSGARASLG